MGCFSSKATSNHKQSSAPPEKGPPILYNDTVILFSPGGVYLTLGTNTTQQCRSTKLSTEATKLTLLPASTLNGPTLKYGHSFFLLSEAHGGFLQRSCIMAHYKDAPNVEPHHSYRWHIGISAEPTQTWVLGYGGQMEEEARYGEVVGVSVAGESKYANRPDNDIRRVLTLRGQDEPQAVVNWWGSDEKVKLVRADRG